uniref:hydroxymethylbilane synthase n=1 Tax=Glossina brevipalpis TaxID=37001 RepID=A0A1A9X150_9MUSC
MASEEIRVGSRNSRLAITQTEHVINRLQESYPKKQFKVHSMTTIGDRVLNISLPKIGEKSLFTRDLEDALNKGDIDIIVHSLKDLPTTLPSGMVIGAILEREDPADALVLKKKFAGKNIDIDTLKKGSVIGTSSLRRTAQLRRRFPHLKISNIRGNLNTRLTKLEGSEFAGIILARAGLVRMDFRNRINQELEPSKLLYAVGQGALAVECRETDAEILKMLRSVMCVRTTCCVLAERSFLKTLGGGCSAPVGVISRFNDNDGSLHLDGAVWSLDGTVEIRDKLSCRTDIEKKDIVISIEREDEPPRKKTRLTDTKVKTLETINTTTVSEDDTDDIKKLSESFNIKDLVEKHVRLVKVTSANNSKLPNQENDELLEKTKEDIANANLLPSDIGLDFMGQCPFVSDDMKIAHAVSDKCPIKTKFYQQDWANIPTSSKCPFTAFLNSNTDNISDIISNSVHKISSFSQSATLNDINEKCKQETDELNNIASENVFCGIYQHASHHRGPYEKSRKLGQMLADRLIKKGALEVMKSAQNEIHAKT